MHLSQIWKYPVKSMIGESIDATTLDANGIVGDRTWAARDLERGGIRGAKKIGGLMRLAAADLPDRPGHVRITLPDGSSVTTADGDVDERVSAALGHPVRLEALRPADDLDHYRRGPADTDDILAELRAVFGRTEDEPLPDLSQFPPVVMEFESPPGTYYDAHPLLIMTTSALASLRRAVPGSAADVRRFRPSLVIDTGTADGHPEFDWIGRKLQIGSAVVDVVGPCPRCVMITREIDDDAPADRAILRHVVADLGQNLGVYAAVSITGDVAVGDAVTVV